MPTRLTIPGRFGAGAAVAWRVFARLSGVGIAIIACALGVLVFHGFCLFGFGGIPTAGRGTLGSRYSVDDLVDEVLLSQAGDTGNTELFCDVLQFGDFSLAET
ncbi:MAG TPA: hypothetical protein VIL33_03050 [Rhodothermia bacterium]